MRPSPGSPTCRVPWISGGGASRFLRPGRRRAQGIPVAYVLADSTRRLFAERAALAREFSFLDLSASDGTDVNRTVERSGSLGPDPPDIVLVIGLARAHGTVLLQVVERVSARGTSADELREAVVGGGLLEPEVVAGLRARLFIVLGAPTESRQPLRHRTA